MPKANNITSRTETRYQHTHTPRERSVSASITGNRLFLIAICYIKYSLLLFFCQEVRSWAEKKVDLTGRPQGIAPTQVRGTIPVGWVGAIPCGRPAGLLQGQFAKISRAPFFSAW